MQPYFSNSVLPFAKVSVDDPAIPGNAMINAKHATLIFADFHLHSLDLTKLVRNSHAKINIRTVFPAPSKAVFKARK